MKRWHYLAALVVTLLGAVSFAKISATATLAQAAGCGPARITLTDPSAADIDTSQIIGVHVSALASFPLPDGLPENSRFDPYETTVYRASGQLIKARLQPDQEIDLVIADPDTDLAITAVFPDTDHCAQSADPNLLQLMQAARQRVIATLGTPGAGGYTALSGQAVVTGIGFIDPDVVAQGESGIEIAPVLDIQFDQAAASAALPAAAVGAAAAPAGTTAAEPAVAVAPVYYVDIASRAAVIFCSATPAQQPINARTVVSFRSLDLALAAYPGYHLSRPC